MKLKIFYILGLIIILSFPSCTSPSAKFAKEKNYLVHGTTENNKSTVRGNPHSFTTIPPEKKLYSIVTSVIDGDTFWLDEGTTTELKVRLIGIDAPETRRTRNKEIGYYAQESKRYLERLVLNRKVRLEFDVDKYDQYHRTLAYVYLEDGTFINAKLLKDGYAVVLTVPPNVRFAEKFLELQQEARENNRGLWQEVMN